MLNIINLFPVVGDHHNVNFSGKRLSLLVNRAHNVFWGQYTFIITRKGQGVGWPSARGGPWVCKHKTELRFESGPRKLQGGGSVCVVLCCVVFTLPFLAFYFFIISICTKISHMHY